jgi:hypothetical protein
MAIAVLLFMIGNVIAVLLFMKGDRGLVVFENAIAVLLFLKMRSHLFHFIIIIEKDNYYSITDHD